MWNRNEWESINLPSHVGAFSTHLIISAASGWASVKRWKRSILNCNLWLFDVHTSTSIHISRKGCGNIKLWSMTNVWEFYCFHRKSWKVILKFLNEPNYHMQAILLFNLNYLKHPKQFATITNPLTIKSNSKTFRDTFLWCAMRGSVGRPQEETFALFNC